MTRIVPFSVFFALIFCFYFVAVTGFSFVSPPRAIAVTKVWAGNVQTTGTTSYGRGPIGRKIVIKRRPSNATNTIPSDGQNVMGATDGRTQTHHHILERSQKIAATQSVEKKKSGKGKIESPRELAAMLQQTMTPAEQAILQSMMTRSDNEIRTATQETELLNIDLAISDEDDDEESDDDYGVDRRVERDFQPMPHVGRKQQHENPKQLAALLTESMSAEEKVEFHRVITKKTTKFNNKKENNGENNEEIETLSETDAIAFVKAYPVRNKEEEEMRDALGAEGLQLLHHQGLSLSEMMSQRQQFLTQLAWEESQQGQAQNEYEERGYGSKKRYKNAQERKKALSTEQEVKEMLRQQREALTSGSKSEVASALVVSSSSNKRRKLPSLNEVMEKFKENSSN
jgi:hypothetical protein